MKRMEFKYLLQGTQILRDMPAPLSTLASSPEPGWVAFHNHFSFCMFSYLWYLIIITRVKNKAQPRLKHSGKMGKTIKRKLMILKLLLEALLKWGLQFLPYQSPLACRVHGGYHIAAVTEYPAQERFPKHSLLSKWLVNLREQVIFIPVSPQFWSILIQETNSISVTVFGRSSSF